MNLLVYVARTLLVNGQSSFKEAMLPEDLHLHNLRHSFATLAIEKEVPIRKIQKHLYHSSIRITEKYLHDESDDGIPIDIVFSELL